jgi:hypothetical protein
MLTGVSMIIPKAMVDSPPCKYLTISPLHNRLYLEVHQSIKQLNSKVSNLSIYHTFVCTFLSPEFGHLFPVLLSVDSGSYQKQLNFWGLTILPLVIIMFMISASTALASIVSSVLALSIVVDDQHRIRIERITDQKIWIWRARDKQLENIANGFAWILEVVKSLPKKMRSQQANSVNHADERQPLLG